VNQYIFDNSAPQTSRRFDSLEQLYDVPTIRFLEATGITTGWHCLEVGGGSGSIANWLAQRVGPTGHVLVTDIDPRFLTRLDAGAQSNLEIRQHDIGADPLPEQAFDLIHARLVLIHVPTPQQALKRMVAALKPDGWIVIEDFDPPLIDRSFPAKDATSTALLNKMLAALVQLRTARGSEFGWGRNLYRHLLDQGLADVGMEGHLTIWRGASVGARLDRANFEQVRTEAVAAGLVTDQEVDAFLALLDDTDLALSSPVMMSAWGRRL
jgi:ubiquinone/menaquinone biosynthesis C-methylase UbiE